MDPDKHHLPHIHAEYQVQVAVYAIEDGWGNCHPKKISWSLLGLRYTKKTLLLIGV